MQTTSVTNVALIVAVCASTISAMLANIRPSIETRNSYYMRHKTRTSKLRSAKREKTLFFPSGTFLCPPDATVAARTRVGATIIWFSVKAEIVVSRKSKKWGQSTQKKPITRMWTNSMTWSCAKFTGNFITLSLQYKDPNSSYAISSAPTTTKTKILSSVRAKPGTLSHINVPTMPLNARKRTSLQSLVVLRYVSLLIPPALCPDM